MVEWGYWGLFLGSLMAATIVPFSSDVLLLGVLGLGGDVVLTVVVASLGNWTGGMISYAMGWLGKWEWIEKYLKVKQSTLIKQKAKIDKYGSLLAFLSWLPVVGDVFAIGLGFYRLNPWKVAIFMFIGKSFRFIMWAILMVYFKDTELYRMLFV